MKSSAPFALVVAIASLCAAERADACGGLFCAAVSPTPVDQTSEKIIFEVDDEGAVTATVEVRYEGNPADFSWIIPIPGTPEFVEVAGKNELLLLDAATAPSFTFPTVTGCGGGGGFGCAEALSARDGASAEGEGEGEGVRVTQYPSVGPFDDIVAVEGGDPRVLADWLRDHGYQVTDGMLPYIEDYTLEGQSFLAVRLRDDAETRDIVPIRFHCPVPNPTIPLRLTAIAAEPQMGFLVFVIGPRRFTTLNAVEVVIDAADVRIDSRGQNNYFPLVSKRIDEAGGFGFVVERAQPAAVIRQRVANTFVDGSEEEQQAREALTTLLTDDRYVTRFYGRMDPDEMLEDPIFTAAPPGSPDVAGIIDLSTQVYDDCTVPTMPVCGGLYCGAEDACAASALGEGCVCGEGRVARLINGPSGRFEVACSSLTIDLHGAGTDACAGAPCGELGTCVPLNDRPTCRCDEGAVAVVDRGLVTCLPQTSGIYDSDTLLWPAFVDDTGCAASRRQAGGSLSLLLLFASGVALRLRRRH
jgi:hypothetical protein